MTLRHVHFVAIGGTGMGSLAGLLARRGVRVTGSDREVYPPMSDALESWGIPVTLGFAARHVLDERPDLVVIGNAVRPDNPEARAAIEAGLPVRSFSDALYELAIRGRHSVVVAGTHGKTTTTALLGTGLLETGRDPSLLVGGLVANFEGSFREGGGPHFVVEGDEYDTVFFDKTPKFLHYHPRTLVVTSIEFDHADIYRDLEHVKAAFRELVRRMPADGTIAAALAQPNVRDVVTAAPCRVVGFGPADGADAGDLVWTAETLAVTPEGTRFRAFRKGRRAADVALPMHGRHNVENALAALATLDVLGVPAEEAALALGRFRGVRRRQELCGEARGVSLIDDFAHHPTAVRETIAAMRARFPGRRLVAVFEPRSNTSRRRTFQKAYAAALVGADRILVRDVPDAPIYSATGEVTERLDAPALAADLQRDGRDAEAFETVEAAVERLAATCEPGDVVLVMSNGAFENLGERLLTRLREGAREGKANGHDATGQL